MYGNVGTKRLLLYAGAIVVVCAALYAGSLRYPFVNWDDYSLVTMNPYITELTWSNVKDIFTPGVVGSYQPLRTLTYAIDYRLWGLDPTGYHITNLLFYVLTCLSVFAFTIVLLKSSNLALWGGLFFATHPLHVEAVTWLSARKETLSGFLFVLALILYARSTRGRTRYYWGSLLCFALALLSKPTVVILPGLLILYDLCFVTGQSLRGVLRRAKWYVPYVALSGILTYITIVLSSKGEVLKEFHGGSAYSQALTTLTVFIKNIRLLFLPVNLSPRYIDYFYVSLREWEALLAVVSCALLVLLAWDAWKRSALVFFCLLWYPITFLPVSNIVPISTLMADRYLFLPSIGFAVLFAFAVGKVSGLRAARGAVRILRPAAVLASIALLAFFSFQTVKQNRIWKNSVSLWSNAVAQDSTNVLAYFALGNVHMENKEPERAIPNYRRAVFLSPGFATAHTCLANAYLADGNIERAVFHYAEALEKGSAEDIAIYDNLGMIYEVKGMFDKAIEQYERALDIDSTSVMARLGLAESYSHKAQYDRAIEVYKELIETNEDVIRARVYFNLGVAQHRNGQYSEALDSYKRAIGIDSTFSDAYYGMGNAYYKMAEFGEAVTSFTRALELEPGHLASMGNLGNVYFDMGMPEEAIVMYKTALDSSSSDLIAMNNLGLAYVEIGNFDGAEEAFRNVIRLYPKDPTGYLNLGYMHMRRGDYREAAGECRKAIDIDPENAVAHYNLACTHALEGRIELGVEALRRALELGFTDHELIRSDPDLNNLRDSSDFIELLRIL